MWAPLGGVDVRGVLPGVCVGWVAAVQCRLVVRSWPMVVVVLGLSACSAHTNFTCLTGFGCYFFFPYSTRAHNKTSDV
jgi:hypothetical protein